MFSPAGWSTLSSLTHIILFSLITCLVAVSAVFLLSQAVRTASNGSWRGNIDTVIIGASYVAVAVVFVAFDLKRRIAIRRKLQRISKVHKTLGKGDVPKTVHNFISQEYARACLIAYESQPPEINHRGVDQTETNLAAVDFRRALLDTVHEVDQMTRLVIPHQPPLMPHDRIVHHLRTVISLFPRDELGLTVVHYYDSAIQLARFAVADISQDEYTMGMDAAIAIKKLLYECRLEMSDDSIHSTNDQTSVEV